MSPSGMLWRNVKDKGYIRKSYRISNHLLLLQLPNHCRANSQEQPGHFKPVLNLLYGENHHHIAKRLRMTDDKRLITST